MKRLGSLCSFTLAAISAPVQTPPAVRLGSVPEQTITRTVVPGSPAAASNARLAEIRQRHASSGKPKSAGEELSRMAELDQEARKTLIARIRAEPDAQRRQAVTNELAPLLIALDAEHKARLLQLIPADGWFRISRDGRDAWLIVQHSQDQALMARVLGAMSRLVRQGEVEPKQYALLYDRVAEQAGRPQRYGSQGTCGAAGTRMTILNLEDPENVDRRRRKIGGNERFVQTLARLDIGRAC